MEQWSGEQRAFAIKSFLKKNDSYVAAKRSFRVYFNLLLHDLVPSAKVIKIWVTNFEETGSVLKKKAERKNTICTPENITAVRTTL